MASATMHQRLLETAMFKRQLQTARKKYKRHQLPLVQTAHTQKLPGKSAPIQAQ
jgi:hypothetical protein